LNATKTTIRFSLPESLKKPQTQRCLPRVPELLTTSYPSELGILRTSVSKCDEKRIVRFFPSFPEDLRVSLPLCFLFPFSLGRLSTPILIQLCRSGSTESNSFSRPEWPGSSHPVPALPRPCGHESPSCPTQFPQGGEEVDTNLVFIQNAVLREPSDLLFLTAMQRTVTLPLGLGN